MIKRVFGKTRKVLMGAFRKAAIFHFHIRLKLVRPHNYLRERIGWYHRWHNFKYHRHIHIGVASVYTLGLIAISLALTFGTYKTVFASIVQVDKIVSGVTEFNQGSLNDVEVVDNAGGEIQIAGNGIANWWDATWQRRVPITVTNTGSAQTNYQIKLTVPYDTDMISNFDDLRFANSSGAPLDYWTQSKTDSAQAVVWVEIDSLAASADTTIYMYYGNIAATPGSNGETTFLFFDNFDDGIIDTNKWVEADPSSRISETGGEMLFNSSSNLGWNNSVYSVPSFSRSDIAFETDYVWSSNNPSYDALMMGWKDNTGGVSNANFVYGHYNYGCDCSATSVTQRVYEDGNYRGNMAGHTWVKDTNYDISLKMRASGGAYYDYSTDSGDTWSNAYTTAYSTESNLRVGWPFFSGTHHFDNTRVRKWMNSEPSSAFGSEETALSPSGTWISSSTVGSGIIDLGWNGGWGVPKGFEADVNIPNNTSIAFEVRSSETGGADPNWSTWQSLGNINSTTGTGDRIFEVTNAQMPLTGALPILTNRYLQVKATLASADRIGNPILKEFKFMYMADQNSPTNPNTINAWQDGTRITSITDASWQNVVAPYFEWSGAQDGVGESGVKGYWVYFGTDNTADPMTAGSWQTGSSYQANIDTAESGKTYYLAISAEDYAGNRFSNGSPNYFKLFTYKFDTTPPDNPAYVTVTPIGWATVSDFRFSWPSGFDPAVNGDASGISGYQYKRAEPTDNWSVTINDNFINNLEAYQNGQNIFYVRSVDNAGNVASNQVQVYYYYNADAPTAPQNTSVVPPNSIDNSFDFSWSEPLTFNGNIKGYYYSVNNLPNAQNTTYTTETNTGEIAAATQQGFNTFYVVAIDDSDNVNWNNYASVQFECNTPAPGIPLALQIFDTSDRDSQNYAVALSWKSPQNMGVGFKNYVVERSIDNTNFTQVGSSASTSYIDVSLESKVYYYRIKASDNAGNISAPSMVISMTPTGRFTSPPNIIDEPELDVKVSTANIRWVTDRDASSFVEIGETTNYGLTQGQFEFVKDHKVAIERLKPNTVYHYRVKYVDFDGNIGYSKDATLKTQEAPSISNVSVYDARLDSILISWNTTAEAKSTIRYGKSTAYSLALDNVSGGFTTSNIVRLSGLDHSSTYNFKIVITDIDGNEIEGENHVFDTLKFPLITNVRMEPVSDKSTATMKFTWQSNVPITSIVEYTPAGGMKQEAVKSQLSTNHELIVTGLMDNTSYTLRVTGRDQFGNQAVSDPQTFKTNFDTRPPKISDITVETSILGAGKDAKGQLVISWLTDEPSTSQVEYGIGVSGDSYSSKTQEDTTLTTSHVVIISDFAPSTSYHFKVVSKDNAGNRTDSKDNSALTEQAGDSVIDIIVNLLQKNLGWMFRIFGRSGE